MKQEEVVYFNIQELLPIGMTFVVLGIGLAYGLSVMGDVRDDMCTYSADAYGNCLNSTGGTGGNLGQTDEYNATVSAVSAVSKIPEKLGLIVTVVLAVVIIGLLIRYLMVRF
jgi:hypothetical protein